MKRIRLYTLKLAQYGVYILCLSCIACDQPQSPVSAYNLNGDGGPYPNQGADVELTPNRLDMNLPPQPDTSSDMNMPPMIRTAPCSASLAGPLLPARRTEADPEYMNRLSALNLQNLPTSYDLSQITGLRLAVIGYMLDQVDISTLLTTDLINRGAMGKAVLLALGSDPQPSAVDFKELRRGLYHFYNCDRGFPSTLEDFKRLYGDFESWPSSRQGGMR